MLWFLFAGFVVYVIYRIYRHYWFRSLQKKIVQFKGAQYKTLSRPDKKKLRSLVETALDSGMTLDVDTNKIVGDVYREIEIEDFYNQGGLGLSEINRRQK